MINAINFIHKYIIYFKWNGIIKLNKIQRKTFHNNFDKKEIE